MLPRFISSRVGALVREQSGSMTILALFFFAATLLFTGIATDLMRNEMERTRTQAALDTAVLAATSLRQQRDPEEVLREYFDDARLDASIAQVTVNQGLGFREVTAVTRGDTPTQFMRFLGRDTLPLNVSSSAQEVVPQVEISLVLDISNSMGSNSKIQNLRVAASEFVDTVLDPRNANRVSLSVVPYTAQVNAGPEIFATLNAARRHPYSSCIDFEPRDFSASGLDYARAYEHMQHFEFTAESYSPIRNPECPLRPFEQIAPITANPAVLSSRIQQLQPRANTAIHIGMKWGVALLDPSFRRTTRNLVRRGLIDRSMRGRPFDYGTPNTLKTVVLMTDGENVDTFRLNPLAYDDPQEIEFWNSTPVFRYLFDAFGFDPGFLTLLYSKFQADTYLRNICTAAKRRGIVVWTIGFEVNNSAAALMEECASSPSTFFRVEGVELADAFGAIARQINQLRLTQ